MHRARAAGLLAALVLAGCAGEGGDARSGTVTVTAEPTAIGLSFGAAGRIHGGSGDERPLAGPLSDALVGTLVPLLVSDPAGGDRVLYQSWLGGRPVLRLNESEEARDTVLVRGALSLAWSRERLAYVRAVTADAVSGRLVGHVVVQPGLHAPESRWTRAPGRYVVAAWAGRSLLVYRLRRGWPDLLALDAPRRVRRLAPAGALVAVSPDGRRAFLARHGASPPVVRVVDVPTGRERARLSLPDVRWVVESGSWSADRVAATTSEGIAVFDVRDERIELEQILRFPTDEFQLAGLEPRLDESAERVHAWASLTPRPREAVGTAVIVACDRFALQCTRSELFSESPGPRIVYNPSRP